MYLLAVKLTRTLFWAALAAGFLGLLLREQIILWLALGLGCGCVVFFLGAVFHVQRTRRRELRCPLCGWVPFALTAWKCKECRFVWDSFSTAGLCPRCGHQHEETACVRCRRISPNGQWVNKDQSGE